MTQYFDYKSASFCDSVEKRQGKNTHGAGTTSNCFIVTDIFITKCYVVHASLHNNSPTISLNLSFCY